MGYNTTIVLYNDALGHIESDKDVGQKIVEATHQSFMNEHPAIFSARRENSVSSAGQAIASHHADVTAVMAVGGNTGRVLCYVPTGTSDEDILKALAKKLGYSVIEDTIEEFAKKLGYHDEG